jgi:hypothetical protein
MFSLIFVALAGLLVWQIIRGLRQRVSRSAARAAFLSQTLPLFDRVTTQLAPNGFPRMTAYQGSLAFDLQLVQDSLTFRKLPTLWLMVTLPHPIPVTAQLHIMARPTGFEPFSNFKSLHHTIDLPLPEDCVARCDDPEQVPQVVAHHCGFFADPWVKELVISPKGLRIVILADEAARGNYLIFRDAELGIMPLPQGRLQPILAALTALRADILADILENVP